MNKLKLDELRKRATGMGDYRTDDFSGSSDYDRRKALQELQIHHIELELQNEELLRVQEELTETRDQYIDLYDFAPVGYLTLGDNNSIVEINLTLTSLLGEPRTELLGKPFSDYIFQEDRDIFAKKYSELIDSQDRHKCELRMRRKNGDWFWAKLECVAKAKSDNSGFRIRIALHDITEQKRLETEIIKAKKLEATALLAGGIAHDFNNLLAIILGNLEMLQTEMQPIGGQPAAQKLRDALQACLAAGNLTKRFLTFSSGGDPFKKLTHVEALIKDSVSLNLAGSNVDFECTFPDNLWPVEIDAGQVAQAIGNVTSNSREAMPHGGMIRVYAENVDPVLEKNRPFLGNQDAKYVKVAIHDQGAGISEEILPQIFDPYFSSKQIGPEKGMGLGLSVTYSIIKKHGGFIDVVSQPGSGTTVYIYLLASDKKIVSLADEPQNALALNKKILVMDDEKMLRELNKHVLESLDYEVEVACDGEEAIQKYAKARQSGTAFGAVILDLTIKGGMGGRETMQRLQKIDPAVRAIVASGYADDPVMSNFKEYGFLDALHKPYKVQDIENSLELHIFNRKDNGRVKLGGIKPMHDTPLAKCS